GIRGRGGAAGAVARESAAAGADGGARPTSRSVAVPVVAWYLVTRVVILAVLVVAVVADLLERDGGPGVAGTAWFGQVARGTWDRLNSWDALWMRDIAEHGYFGLDDVDGDPGHWRSLAFFPLMPYLMRGVSFVGFMPAAWAGALISLVAGVFVAFAAAALASR